MCGPKIELGEGDRTKSVPQLGLGTWQSKPGEVQRQVEVAIEAGYRHIDTQWVYVGVKTLRKHIKNKIESSIIPCFYHISIRKYNILQTFYNFRVSQSFYPKVYGNEEEVGNGIKQKLDDCTLKSRGELFVCTKLWNSHKLKENVGPQLKNSLKLLKLDYVDLYLIHWPHLGYEMYN